MPPRTNNIILDECRFCVREFWEPWVYELLHVEEEAKEEETVAVFAARDATSTSERNLALQRRLVAADALLAARTARLAVITVLKGIEAEKEKRNIAAKAALGIFLKRTLDKPEIHYKRAIEEAKRAKKLQEDKYAIMKHWMKQWQLREKRIALRGVDKDEFALQGKKEQHVKPTLDKKDPEKKHDKDAPQGHPVAKAPPKDAAQLKSGTNSPTKSTKV